MLTWGALGFLPLFFASLATFLACSLTLRMTLYLCRSVWRLLFEPLLFFGIVEPAPRPQDSRVSTAAWSVAAGSLVGVRIRTADVTQRKLTRRLLWLPSLHAKNP